MARDLVVMSQLMNGLPKDESEICTEVGELRVYRDQLSIVGGVLVCDGAVATLTELRQAVADIVGPACQGIQVMGDRAANTVFWWNIDEDISKNEKTGQTGKPARWDCTVGLRGGTAQWDCIVGLYSGTAQWDCNSGTVQ